MHLYKIHTKQLMIRRLQWNLHEHYMCELVSYGETNAIKRKWILYEIYHGRAKRYLVNDFDYLM